MISCVFNSFLSHWCIISSLNTSTTYKNMNCHKKSEAHLWRYSKHNKTRRCLKCKSLIPITEKEYYLKWGMHENTTKKLWNVAYVKKKSIFLRASLKQKVRDATYPARKIMIKNGENAKVLIENTESNSWIKKWTVVITPVYR